MKKILRLFLVALFAIVGLNHALAADITDELTLSTFGVSGTSYKDVANKTATSTAVYSANMAGGNNSIQLRTTNNNSGIVTTASGGTIKSIKIEWNSNTADARTLDVYGSSTAYNSATALYSSETQGTKIASFKKSDGTKTVEIDGSYQFIGFRSNSGAMYIDKITIVWDSSADVVIAPVFSVPAGTYFEAQQVTMSSETEGADIFYTTDGSEPDEGATKYTAPISLSVSTTLRAIAIKGSTVSNITTAVYNIYTGTTGKGTAESPLTVADALSVIATLADNGTTSPVYVTGYVIGEISVASGQASFKIGATSDATEDLVTVYKAKGLENDNYKDGDAKAGDIVVIYAALQKYVKEEVVTPETQFGYIYSINGATTPDAPVLVGDGSKENPFTVADLRKMRKADYPADAVWVKGVIIGSAKNATTLNTEDADSNIAVAATATDTEFIPVELVQNTDFRTKLNVKDNPANEGKDVLLLGKIAEYFSTTGVKSLSDAIIDGESVVTGINDIKVAADVENAPVFNLAGQKVSASYKGVVIKGGKKMIVK